MNFQKNDLSMTKYMLYSPSTKHTAPLYVSAFTPGNNVSELQSGRTDVESDLRGVTRKLSECESVKNSFLKNPKLVHLKEAGVSKPSKPDCNTCSELNTMKPTLQPKPRSYN